MRNDLDDSLMGIARRIFLEWEKLRIAYVIVFALVTVTFTGFVGLFQLRILPLVIGGAVMANLAFFAGPIVETYVRWLGYNRLWPRWVMFLSGMMISIALTVGVLATVLLPSQP